MAFKRIIELYSEGGASEVFRGIRDYFHYNVFNRGTPNYHNIRIDNEDRWDYLSEFISHSSSLVDIGCAEGFFTVRSAKNGIVSIGIDTKEERIGRARKNAETIDKCGIIKWDIGPNNINQLPRVDVILLMTVHHHWEQEYGLDIAEQMFQLVMDRCDTLVYEPPGDRPIIKNQDGNLNPNMSLDYYIGRLQALYGDSIEIIDCQMFPHTVGDKNQREDPLFVIDVSEYRLDE